MKPHILYRVKCRVIGVRYQGVAFWVDPERRKELPPEKREVWAWLYRAGDSFAEWDISEGGQAFTSKEAAILALRNVGGDNPFMMVAIPVLVIESSVTETIVTEEELR